MNLVTPEELAEFKATYLSWGEFQKADEDCAQDYREPETDPYFRLICTLEHFFKGENMAMAMKAEHAAVLSSIHGAVAAGIPWSTILQWLVQFGLQYVLPLLAIILPLIIGGKLTVAQAIEYGFAYLEAAVTGQPLPPPPGTDPVPATP